MSAYTLVLKIRPVKGSININIERVRTLIDAGHTEEFLADVRRVLEVPGVHDKAWLEMIVNHVPEGGKELSEMAKWFSLAKRIGELDETREGTFSLSEWQANLIWSRLTGKDFKLRALDRAFLEFILDLQDATGRHFPEEDPNQ